MSYFDDITFINAGFLKNCQHNADMRYPHKYSLQFNQQGIVSLGINHQKPVLLEGPVLYWFLPENSYQYGWDGKSGYIHHYINFWGPRGNKIMREGFQQLSTDGYVYVYNPEEFVPVYMQLRNLVTGWDPQFQVQAVLLLEQLLALMLESRKLETVKNPFRDKINKLADDIKEKPFNHWDFRKVAQQKFYISYSHFRRNFREIMQIAPHEYLLDCRIFMTVKMLRENELSIKEIADKAGFIDPARFSRMFKNRIGLSPRNYLKALER